MPLFLEAEYIQKQVSLEEEEEEEGEDEVCFVFLRVSDFDCRRTDRLFELTFWYTQEKESFTR